MTQRQAISLSLGLCFKPALSLIIAAVILMALLQLCRSLLPLLITGAIDPLDHGVFQTVFGSIFTVLIALEFKHSIVRPALRRNSVVQVRTVLLIALLALSRKFVILDTLTTPASTIAALGFATLVLGVVCWLLSKKDLSAHDQQGIDMNTIAFSFPEFSLGEYLLRRIEPQDIQTVFAGLSHPRVIAHYGVSYASLEATAEQMHWYDQLVSEGSGIWWAVARCMDNEMIGACGFNNWQPDHHRIDLGYWLLPDYWGRGIMQCALPPILRHAFTLMNVHRVHADVEPENLASFHLLRKLGFVHEGTLREVEFKDGNYFSLHQLSLISTDPAAIALQL